MEQAKDNVKPEEHIYRIGNHKFIVAPVYKGTESMTSILLKLMISDAGKMMDGTNTK